MTPIIEPFFDRMRSWLNFEEKLLTSLNRAPGLNNLSIWPASRKLLVMTSQDLACVQPPPSLRKKIGEGDFLQFF